MSEEEKKEYQHIRIQQILFDRRAFYSQLRSSGFLRIAKAAAKKSHQEALRAKALYDAQHGRA